MRVLLLCIAALLWTRADACPTTVSALCLCQVWVRGLFVSCDGEPLERIVHVLQLENARLHKLQIYNAPNLTALTRQSFGTLTIPQIDLSHNQIAEVSSDAFSEMATVVEEIILENNSLTQMPMFSSNMTQLQSINVNLNQLSDVPDDAFGNATGLRQLRIQQNLICKLSFAALAELGASLELLDMSENCFTRVPSQNLRRLTRLMYLDFGANKIADLPNMSIMNMPLLKEVRLNDNQILTIGPLGLLNVPELQYLYMQNNSISVLDPSRFSTFNKLQLIDFSGNKIKVIPSSAFSKVASLKQVLLDRNAIEVVQTASFSSNPNLHVVSLQNNKLRDFQRNAFDSSDGLKLLLLNNNELKSIGTGMFEGIRNLEQLSLRSNGISQIDSSAFDAVAQLTRLDLGSNQLTSVPTQLLHPLKRLFWLDLSQNQLTVLRTQAFPRKISNIILHGNPWVCDDQLDGFVNYLVRENVRTFLPDQPDVTCAAPPALKGTRLKELLIQRANESFFRTINSLKPAEVGDAPTKGIPFENLFPSLKELPGLSEGIPGLTSSIPALNSLSSSIPGLNQMPDISSLIGLNKNLPPGAPNPAQGLGDALTEFTAPLTNMVGRSNPVSADVSQLVGSIPKLAGELSELGGGIDLSKVDPALIKHVMNGGQIPGVPKPMLDRLIQQYYRKVAEAAMAANAGTATEATLKSLPPVSALPAELIQQVLSGQPLPGLTTEQTDSIKTYYTRAMTIATAPNDATGSGGADAPKSKIITGIPTDELLSKLPPGFDLSRLPPLLLEQIASGRTPDLSLLPPDMLQQLLQSDLASLIPKADSREVPAGDSNDVLRNLPPTRPIDVRPTFQPYDISELDRQSEQDQQAGGVRDNSNLLLYITIAGVSIVAVITMCIVCFFCLRRRVANRSANNSMDRASFFGVTPDNAKPTPEPAVPASFLSSPADPHSVWAQQQTRRMSAYGDHLQPRSQHDHIHHY